MTVTAKSTARRTKGWLSIPEAAIVLGMSKQTLWRRVRTGRLTLPHVDGRLVVPSEQVAAMARDPNITARPYRRRASSVATTGGADLGDHAPTGAQGVCAMQRRRGHASSLGPLALVRKRGSAALTVADVVNEWLVDRRADLRDTSFTREQAMLQCHVLNDQIAVVCLSELRRRDAVLFSKRLKGRPNGRGGMLAARTRRNVLITIRQAFDASEFTESNPFRGVPLPRRQPVEIAFLTERQLRQLLEGATQDRWGWVFVTLALTGLRRAELCGLRWDSVDLARGHLHVRWCRATAAGQVVESRPKTPRSSRRLPLDPLVLAQLRLRAGERDAHRAAWESAWDHRGDDYVWANEDGSLPHPDRLTAAFAHFCRRIEIPNVGLHGLRHTFATAAIAAGVSPFALSRALGHASVVFTYDRYGHLWDDGLPTELAKLTALLGTDEPSLAAELDSRWPRVVSGFSVD